MNKDYTAAFDVIVIGGGHAGMEAAYAAARMGSKTLMITLNIDRIGHMPCNPAIGGIGKGHMVFEISALGGLMPQLCTKTYLQARMLNTRRGPAVQGLRLQIDKQAYSQASRQVLSNTPNLTITMGMADQVLFTDNGHVSGITTREGAQYHAPCVILTTGTFLKGLVHVGHTNYSAGRQGEESVSTLSDFLKSLDLVMGRLKTGTPPRLIRSSLDFSKMEEQKSDQLEYLFEFAPHKVEHKISCFITHTTPETHDVIRNHATESPIYTGVIKGTPPRYCPSIEDKISRFADKETHHVFVEPESASSDEIYPNGLSTSLPLSVQREFIRTIPGFESAIIARPGYAIEYDYVAPHQLTHSLELKKYPGLFLAGQINGTTGYEEAASQGIIAGINAHLKRTGQEPFIINRHEGYIGIMIDDLVTLGVDEPYRMFTSRAERRLLLRQDNVFVRLGERAHKLKLLSDEVYKAIAQENNQVKLITSTLRAQAEREISQLLSQGETVNVLERIKTTDNLLREKRAEDQELKDISKIPVLSQRGITSVYAELLYGPYLIKEEKEVEKSIYYQSLTIPTTFQYTGIPGLSKELQEKLNKHKPQTIAQAALIQGMTPAAISLLIFKVREELSAHNNDATNTPDTSADKSDTKR